jgi:hypothetical protein
MSTVVPQNTTTFSGSSAPSGGASGSEHCHQGDCAPYTKMDGSVYCTICVVDGGCERCKRTSSTYKIARESEHESEFISYCDRWPGEEEYDSARVRRRSAKMLKRVQQRLEKMTAEERDKILTDPVWRCESTSGQELSR